MTYAPPTVCPHCKHSNGGWFSVCPICKLVLWESAPDFDVPHDGLEV